MESHEISKIANAFYVTASVSFSQGLLELIKQSMASPAFHGNKNQLFRHLLYMSKSNILMSPDGSFGHYNVSFGSDMQYRLKAVFVRDGEVLTHVVMMLLEEDLAREFIDLWRECPYACLMFFPIALVRCSSAVWQIINEPGQYGSLADAARKLLFMAAHGAENLDGKRSDFRFKPGDKSYEMKAVFGKCGQAETVVIMLSNEVLHERSIEWI